MTSEKRDKDAPNNNNSDKNGEGGSFKIQSIYDVMDCVFVIDSLAKLLLIWLKKFEKHQHVASTIHDLNAIRAYSRAIKYRMHNATEEACGSESAAKVQSHHKALWLRIRGNLGRMRFFK